MMGPSWVPIILVKYRIAMPCLPSSQPKRASESISMASLGIIHGTTDLKSGEGHQPLVLSGVCHSQRLIHGHFVVVKPVLRQAQLAHLPGLAQCSLAAEQAGPPGEDSEPRGSSRICPHSHPTVARQSYMGLSVCFLVKDGGKSALWTQFFPVGKEERSEDKAKRHGWFRCIAAAKGVHQKWRTKCRPVGPLDHWTNWPTGSADELSN